MPDGTVPLPERDPAEDRALAADHRLLRDVRWRLVAWSGLTTLVVLLVLGSVLYVAVDRSLAATGTAQLEERARVFVDYLDGPGGGRPEPGLGFVFGGGASGTYAMLVDADGDNLLARAPDPPPGLPDVGGIDSAATSAEDVRTATVEGVPVRVLTWKVATSRGDAFIQVVGDRTAEQRTLDVILVVLIVGGLVVVGVASAVGAMYARRALVPIRQSLAAQRVALRRQREFAADASHELRTPLAVIRSSLEHLRRHPQAPVASMGEAVEDIDAEVSHLTTLVDDLLLLARSDSGALTVARLPVDLGDIAADAASALVKPAAAREVRLVVDPEPAVVPGDAARLRQLVLILLDNAVRHTPHGGDVRLRVRRSGVEAVLDVEDDGPGIRGADLPHIFERFWRAPGSPGGGSGLGLAIAARIVELHGGRIAVANRPPAGACFRVTLPASDGEAWSPPVEPRVAVPGEQVT